MKVLVTGGAGFIGSHTCVELLKSGHDVILVDNFSNSKKICVERIEQISGKKVQLYPIDIRNQEEMERIFSENTIDCVIHFAGYKAVGESVKLPLKYYQNNLTGTIVLLEVMEKYGCRRMVFSSSATVYGPENPIPYVETMKTNEATNPYGWTKVMIEQMLRDLSAANPEWSIALLRYFNPIGAHPSGLIGEDPQGIPNNLVPYIAKVATGELKSLGVFGNDYDTPDGTGVRDYIHVVDLAVGHVKALDYVTEHNGVLEVNLGTGRGSSVMEILHAYERACGHTLAYQIKPRRAGDLPAFYADTTKAKKLLGWEAQYTIEEMCRDSWNFVKLQMEENKTHMMK
jgi:UDP-glucose 4-epimerase